MHKILVTAFREFKSTALTPAFIIATFVIPVVFYAVLIGVLASGALDSQPPKLEGAIGIIDQAPSSMVERELRAYFDPDELAERRQRDIDNSVNRAMSFAQHLGNSRSEEVLRSQFENQEPPIAEVTIERIDPSADLDEQRERVRSGELKGLIVTAPDALDNRDSVVDVIVSATTEDKLADQIERGAQEAVVSARFARTGISQDIVREISARPRSNRVTLTEGSETTSGEKAAIIIPLAAIFLLFMAVFSGSSYLLMSTVEEKASRVIEVLLSAISPTQLMAGKILGQALVGFTILAVYGGFGLAAAGQFEVLELISPLSLAYLVVYFLLGYFSFAAVLAAIGASVNEMREAQAMQGPVLGGAILVIYLGVFAALNDPNSMITSVLSWVPLASPFIMSMRIGNPTDPPPTWEVMGTIVLGIVTVAALIWVSAKIFRIGVLMYGKPPSFKDLAKMVRQA